MNGEKGHTILETQYKGKRGTEYKYFHQEFSFTLKILGWINGMNNLSGLLQNLFSQNRRLWYSYREQTKKKK